MTQMIWYTINWPLADIDAAVHRNLSDIRDSTIPQFDFERRKVTEISVVYSLSYPDRYPGAEKLGQIELCRRPDGDTAMIVTRPQKPPFRTFNDDESESSADLQGENLEHKIAKIVNDIERERLKTHERCIARQNGLLENLFRCLQYDPVLRITEASSADDTTDESYEPTDHTKELALFFRDLKNKNPEWSQHRVAMEACERLKVINFTNETVRYAYRAMRKAFPDQVKDWTWERADRVR